MRRQGFEIKSSIIQMVFWIKTTKMLSKETLRRLGLLLKTCCNQREFVKYENHKSAVDGVVGGPRVGKERLLSHDRIKIV